MKLSYYKKKKEISEAIYLFVLPWLPQNKIKSVYQEVPVLVLLHRSVEFCGDCAFLFSFFLPKKKRKTKKKKRDFSVALLIDTSFSSL